MSVKQEIQLSKADKCILDAILMQKTSCRKKERVCARPVPPSTSSSSTAGHFRERSYLGFMKRRMRIGRPPTVQRQNVARTLPLLPAVLGPPPIGAMERSWPTKNSRPSYVSKPSTNVVANFFKGFRRRESAGRSTSPRVDKTVSSHIADSSGLVSTYHVNSKSKNRWSSDDTLPRREFLPIKECEKCGLRKNRGSKEVSTSVTKGPPSKREIQAAPEKEYKRVRDRSEEINESRNRLIKFFQSFPKDAPSSIASGDQRKSVSSGGSLQASSEYFLASEGEEDFKETDISKVEILIGKQSLDGKYCGNTGDGVCLDKQVSQKAVNIGSSHVRKSVEKLIDDSEVSRSVQMDSSKRQSDIDPVEGNTEKETALVPIVFSMLETERDIDEDSNEVPEGDKVSEDANTKQPMSLIDSWRCELNTRFNTGDSLTEIRSQISPKTRKSKSISFGWDQSLSRISEEIEEDIQPEVSRTVAKINDSFDLASKFSTESGYLGADYFPKEPQLEKASTKSECLGRDFLPVLADAVSRSSAYLSSIDVQNLQEINGDVSAESSSSAQSKQKEEIDASKLGNIFDHLKRCVNMYFLFQAQTTEKDLKVETESMRDLLSYIGSNVNSGKSARCGNKYDSGGKFAECMGLEGMPWLASSNASSDSEEKNNFDKSHMEVAKTYNNVDAPFVGRNDIKAPCRSYQGSSGSSHTYVTSPVNQNIEVPHFGTEEGKELRSTIRSGRSKQDVGSSTREGIEVPKVDSLHKLEKERKISTHTLPDKTEDKTQYQENWHFRDFLPTWRSRSPSSGKVNSETLSDMSKGKCDMGCQTDEVKVHFGKREGNRITPSDVESPSSEQSSLDVFEEAIERDFYFVENTDDQLSVDDYSSVDRLFGGSWTSWKDGRRKEGHFVALPNYRQPRTNSNLWPKSSQGSRPKKCVKCSARLRPSNNQDTSVRYLFVSEQDKLKSQETTDLKSTGDDGNCTWNEESRMETDFLDDVNKELGGESKCFVDGREVNVIPWRDTTYGNVSLHQVETDGTYKQPVFYDNGQVERKKSRRNDISEVKFSVSRYGERDDQSRSFVEIDVQVDEDTQFVRSTLMKEAPRVVGGILVKGPTRAARKRVTMRRSDHTTTEVMQRTFTTEYQTPSRCVVKEVTHYMGDRWMRTTYRNSSATRAQPTSVVLKLLVYFAQPICTVMGQMRGKTSSVVSATPRQRSPRKVDA